jgi:DNA-binding transcriptional regulator YdaS (Cro superfamily)
MSLEHDLDTPLAEACIIAGGQSALGRICGRRQSSIRELLKKGRPLWAESVLAVEAATGVPKERLRPDIYRPIAEGESDNQPIGTRADGRRPAGEPVNLLP